ncbi:hypothetical protein K439DRAFT_1641849 [Ramaria rubella]|nr:hypothetical protein K439DRAFT_1641849 [Ramaria rubella]
MFRGRQGSCLCFSLHCSSARLCNISTAHAYCTRFLFDLDVRTASQRGCSGLLSSGEQRHVSTLPSPRSLLTSFYMGQENKFTWEVVQKFGR